MKRYLAVSLLVLLSATAPPVWSHEQKEAITRVLFNPRTDNIEVMHRFQLHDVEHAVKVLRTGKTDILAAKADREFFSRYVQQRFSIADQDGRVLPLTPVGNEIEGRFLWVYAETAIPDGITALNLRHDALRELWREQVNLVNVEVNGRVKSVTFMGPSTELTVPID